MDKTNACLKIVFKEYGKSVDQISSKYEKGRNILYVAVTRAIKNLRILYIDDLEEIRIAGKKFLERYMNFKWNNQGRILGVFDKFDYHKCCQ